MRPKNLIIGFILGVALAAGVWVALATVPVSSDRHMTTATILPTTVELPPVSLLDQHGNRITEAVFKGQWDLVFFGFTNCPDVCPLTLQILNTAKTQLQVSGKSPLPRIVLVSVDPERDTPDNMSAYLDNFGEDNLGITGDLEEIRKLTSALGIFFEKRIGDDDYYAVDHSAVVLVIDPDGRFHALFSSPHTADNFIRDLPLLMRS